MSIESFKDGLGNQLYRMTIADADPVLLDMVQAFYQDTKRLRSYSPPLETEEPWQSDKTAMTYPPNCEGLNSPESVSASNSPEAVAEVLLARTEGDE